MLKGDLGCVRDLCIDPTPSRGVGRRKLGTFELFASSKALGCGGSSAFALWWHSRRCTASVAGVGCDLEVEKERRCGEGPSGDPDRLPNSDCSLSEVLHLHPYTKGTQLVATDFHHSRTRFRLLRVTNMDRIRNIFKRPRQNTNVVRLRRRRNATGLIYRNLSKITFVLTSLCSHRVNEFLCHRSGSHCLQLVTYGWPSSPSHHFLSWFTLTKMRCSQLRCVLLHRT